MVVPERLADILVGELAATFPGQWLLGAWFYGSRARGEARAGSDVDLAVLCDEPLDPVALFDASGRLSARLGATVDLVDLQRAGGLLRVEATHHGRPLTPLSASSFTPDYATQSDVCRDRRMRASCVANGSLPARAVATMSRSAGSW